MQNGPDADLRRGWRQGQRRRSQVKRNLSRKHSHDHFDDERDRDQPRHQSGKQQQSTDNLKATDEMCGEMRKGHAQLRESPHALVRIHELQDSLPQENSTRHNS